MKKRVVSMVLALVMLCNLTVSAWAEDPIVASGQCGDSDTESRIQWLLWNTGKLEISGEGHMEHYSRNGVPWKKYKEQITEVVIYGPQDELKSCAFHWKLCLLWVCESDNGHDPGNSCGNRQLCL